MKNHKRLSGVLSFFISFSFAQTSLAYTAQEVEQALVESSFYAESESAELTPAQIKTAILEDDEAETADERADEQNSKKDRILIAGDSWAFFPCIFSSMRKMLRRAGKPIESDRRCIFTSKNGIRAKDWLGSKFDLRVTKYLKKNDRIKYLYLSLGGNDLLREWHKDMTPDQVDALQMSALKSLKKITAKYIAIKPNLKIIVGGYDYGRLTSRNLIPLYSTIFKKMLQPTYEEVNNILIDTTIKLAPIANGKNIFYIHHLGLSHYYDGVPEQGLQPFVTMPPDQISAWDNPLAMGGDKKLPNGKVGMINWLHVGKDAIHLSSTNYLNAMGHLYNNVLIHIMP